MTPNPTSPDADPDVESESADLSEWFPVEATFHACETVTAAPITSPVEIDTAEGRVAVTPETLSRGWWLVTDAHETWTVVSDEQFRARYSPASEQGQYLLSEHPFGSTGPFHTSDDA